MFKQRRQNSPELEALRGVEPIHAMAAKHQVYPVQVSQREKEVAERLPEVFGRKRDADAAEMKERERELLEQIGRMKMVPRNAVTSWEPKTKPLDWLKKSWPARALNNAVA